MIPDLPLPADIDARIDSLSDRERACLERAAARMQQKAIAHELGIGSAGTVDGYIASGARKLGLKRREALRLFAERILPGNPGEEIPGIVEVEPEPALEVTPQFPWPFPTRSRPNNDLGRNQTFIAIVIGASLLLAALALLMLATKIVSQPG